MKGGKLSVDLTKRFKMLLEQNSSLLALHLLLDTPRSVPCAGFSLPLHSLLLVLPDTDMFRAAGPVGGGLHPGLDHLPDPYMLEILCGKEDSALWKHLINLIQHLKQPARFLARFPDSFAGANHADDGRGFQS